MRIANWEWSIFPFSYFRDSRLKMKISCMEIASELRFENEGCLLLGILYVHHENSDSNWRSLFSGIHACVVRALYMSKEHELRIDQQKYCSMLRHAAQKLVWKTNIRCIQISWELLNGRNTRIANWEWRLFPFKHSSCAAWEWRIENEDLYCQSFMFALHVLFACLLIANWE